MNQVDRGLPMSRSNGKELWRLDSGDWVGDQRLGPTGDKSVEESDRNGPTVRI